MQRRYLTLAATLLLVILSPAAQAADDLAIEHQGASRHALMHAPSPMPAGKLPLMIYLHGTRPPGWKNHTQPAMDSMADREGVLTAYPEPVGF